MAAVIVDRMWKHDELDWVRTSTDVRRLSSACISWFRGKDPCIPKSGFVSSWGPEGVLCAVTGGTAVGLVPAVPLRVTVLLSTSVPWALPLSLAPLPAFPEDLH